MEGQLWILSLVLLLTLCWAIYALFSRSLTLLTAAEYPIGTLSCQALCPDQTHSYFFIALQLHNTKPMCLHKSKLLLASELVLRTTDKCVQFFSLKTSLSFGIIELLKCPLV